VEQSRVHDDRTGNTLTIWFADPDKEYFCAEIADDAVLMKDRRERVLGFERLNYLPRKRRTDKKETFLWKSRSWRSGQAGISIQRGTGASWEI